MAIRDLCSRQVLASVAFLTGPVDGSFIIRSVWLGKLVVFVFEVPTTMAQCDTCWSKEQVCLCCQAWFHFYPFGVVSTKEIVWVVL